MTWTRLSDDFPDDPRVLGLTDAAFRCHVSAIIWCNQQLTDGRLPKAALIKASLPNVGRADELAAELVESGLWSAHAGHWQLDWEDQELAANVERRAQQNRDRQDTYRKRRDAHSSGDHSLCNPEFCNALRNALRTPLVTAPRPDPTRPDPSPNRGQGQGRSGDATPPPPGGGDANQQTIGFQPTRAPYPGQEVTNSDD